MLKVDSEAELFRIYEEAKKMVLPVVLVVDAGFTQLPPNTPTCVGIGPCPDELVDRMTKDLKLL